MERYDDLEEDDFVDDEPLWMEFRRRRFGSFDVLEAFSAFREAPVDVEDIAARMGVTVKRVTRPGWEGAVQGEELTHRAFIWVNDSASPERQRFTIAHELGHLMLHPLDKHYRDAAFGYGKTVPRREHEANAFAGALLMPRFLMTPLISDTAASVKQMANHFQVSQAAMNVRISWILRGKSDL